MIQFKRMNKSWKCNIITVITLLAPQFKIFNDGKMMESAGKRLNSNEKIIIVISSQSNLQSVLR